MSYPPPPYPNQGYGAPPPAFNQAPPPGFNPGYGYPPSSGFPTSPPGQQGGYPPAQGYPPPSGFPMPPTIGHMPPQSNMYNSVYGGEHVDAMPDGSFDFSDKVIRHGFIRKVYSILMLQLLVTLCFVAVFIFHTPTKMFVARNVWVVYVAFALMLVVTISMACCSNLRRKTPGNYIFLGIFTLAQSFVCGAVSSTYQSNVVFIAIGICAVVCLSLSIFAFQTKWDFTIMGGVLFVAVIILMLFGIITIFVQGKTMTLIYGCLGALIFSVYLIYDTQMMIGGKHKYSISPEEYIFAALTLYIDIINIFMYILTIMGVSRD